MALSLKNAAFVEISVKNGESNDLVDTEDFFIWMQRRVQRWILDCINYSNGSKTEINFRNSCICT
jgi:hypothetical protein